MNAKEYIKHSLATLGKTIVEEIKIEYVFDYNFDQHIIKITPDSIFQSEEFAKIQVEFELKFIKMFPNDELLFITEGHGLELPQFEFIHQKKEEGNPIKLIQTSVNFAVFVLSSFNNLGKNNNVSLLIEPDYSNDSSILQNNTKDKLVTTDLNDADFFDSSSTTLKQLLNLNSPSKTCTLFESSELEAVS